MTICCLLLQEHQGHSCPGLAGSLCPGRPCSHGACPRTDGQPPGHRAQALTCTRPGHQQHRQPAHAQGPAGETLSTAASGHCSFPWRPPRPLTGHMSCWWTRRRAGGARDSLPHAHSSQPSSSRHTRESVCAFHKPWLLDCETVCCETLHCEAIQTSNLQHQSSWSKIIS